MPFALRLPPLPALPAQPALPRLLRLPDLAGRPAPLVPLALGTGAALLPTAAAVAVAVEVRGAMRRAVLPAVPDYVIDTVVPATGRPEVPVPLRLLVLGDSTAAGVGAPRLADCLPVQIASLVAGAAGRPVHVVGHGRASARTREVLERQVPLVEGATADAALVLVGPNDVVFRTPPHLVRRQTLALLDHLTGALQAPVVLAGNLRFAAITNVGPLVRSLADGYAAHVGSAQHKAVRRFGEAASFVDLSAEAGRFRGVPDLLAIDGFHPSPQGYRLMAEAIAPAVVTALGFAGPSAGADGAGGPGHRFTRRGALPRAPGGPSRG